MQAGSQVPKAKVYFQFICSVLQHENKKFEKTSRKWRFI